MRSLALQLERVPTHRNQRKPAPTNKKTQHSQKIHNLLKIKNNKIIKIIVSQFSRPLRQSNGQANSVLSWSLSVDIHSCLHEVYIPIDENQKRTNTDILESNKSQGFTGTETGKEVEWDRMCNKMVKTERILEQSLIGGQGARCPGKSILGRKAKCKELGTLFAYSRNSTQLNLIEVKQIKKMR